MADGGQQGQDTQGGGSWADSLEPDMKTWVGGMGLDKLPEREALTKVLPMYRGAEQKLGVPADQVLRLPGKDAKPEDWKPIWQKLGAPEKPEDYGLQAPEGHDGEFLKTASSWFAELGIPKQQAAGLAERWNQYVESSQAAANEAWNTRHDQELEALKGVWKGEEFNRNMDLATRVMKAAGFNDDQLKAMERALGPKALLEGFAKFAGYMGEHRFIGNNNASNFGAMSPEAAKARIDALAKDVQWQDARRKGDADKQAEWTKLHQDAYGNAPANPEAVAA